MEMGHTLLECIVTSEARIAGPCGLSVWQKEAGGAPFPETGSVGREQPFGPSLSVIAGT